jgi:uncharacterized protein (DUF849 family)
LTFIKAAINGARRGGPVPETIAAMALAVKQSFDAGADAVHVHVRDANGGESLHADDVAALMTALRFGVGAAGPAAHAGEPPAPTQKRGSIGVSTGAWIVPDPVRRHDLIAAWHAPLPDFASVNFSEEGAIEVANALLALGVDVEAGLIDAASARLFVESGIEVIRILLEPQEQQLAAALQNADEMLRVVEGIDAPRLLHGFDATAWPLFDEAVQRGFQTRIGLEDLLESTNAELITAARARALKASRPAPRR